MNLYEFADFINKEITIKRCPNQNNRFVAMFEHSETKKNKSDCILCKNYGNGNSPEEALNDYRKKIQGKVLIFDAMSEKRQEYKVPNSLTLLKHASDPLKKCFNKKCIKYNEEEDNNCSMFYNVKPCNKSVLDCGAVKKIIPQDFNSTISKDIKEIKDVTCIILDNIFKILDKRHQRFKDKP